MYLVFVFPKGQYGSKYGPKSDSMKKVGKTPPKKRIIQIRRIYSDVKPTFNNLHQDFDIMKIVHTAMDAYQDNVGFTSKWIHQIWIVLYLFINFWLQEYLYEKTFLNYLFISPYIYIHTLTHTNLYVCLRMHVCTNPSARTGFDTRSIF